MGIVTGQGLIGLIRERYGVRWTAVALVALLGRQRRHALRGVRRHRRRRWTWPASRATSACPSPRPASRLLVLRGASGASSTSCSPSAPSSSPTSSPAFLAHPDWARRGARPRGPDMPLGPRRGRSPCVATIGHDARALGPGVHPVVCRRQATAAARPAAGARRRRRRRGADRRHRRLRRDRLRRDAARRRARSSTTHATRRRRSSRSPGRPPRRCSASGCSARRCWRRRSLPLSTAYSVTEAARHEAAARRHASRDARALLRELRRRSSSVAVVVVCIPGAPLIPILFLSQALNAVLLLPLLVFMRALGARPPADGRARAGTARARSPRPRRSR